MVDLVIGATSMAGFLILLNHARRHKMRLSWWSWLLTVLGFIYAVFVLEVISSFLEEGAPQAALVIGLILGMVAVLWGVLLARFVFARAVRN